MFLRHPVTNIWVQNVWMRIFMERSPDKNDDLARPTEQGDATVSLGLPVPPAPGTPVLQPGTIVEGRLEVQSLIASGGFGSVHKVRHLLMNKTLALKTLHPIVSSATTILRLQRESVAVAKLNHPNIVHAMDFGLIDGTIPYIVMEYVEGQTLAAALKGQPPMPVDEALKLFIPICEAMAYAHDQGIIHRDIKPGNIMLSLDERDSSRVIPKIVDFGIAKLTFGEDAAGLALTRTGEIFGTPLYMSPEQCAGTSVDHRADIYALGCVLFETLTGAPPISGNTALETMMRHTTGVVPSLKEASLGKEFPAALEFVVAKMLAKEPRQRYQNCYNAANDLRMILQGDAAGVSATAAPGESQNGAAQAPLHLDRIAVTIVGLVILVVGIIGGIAIQPLVIHTSPKTWPRDPFATSNQAKSVIMGLASSALGFFHSDEKPDVFQFPEQPSLGTLYWLESDNLVHKEAQHAVTFPPNCKIELVASDALMSSPPYWGGFRPTDLWGLHLKTVTFLDSDHALDDHDAAVAAAWQQRKLNLLELADMVISERAFKLIGSMGSITHLSLVKVRIASNANDANILPLTTRQVAALPNLHQIISLRLTNLSGSLAPILHELRAGQIRHLVIWNCDVAPEDLDQIAQMPTLETLMVLTNISCDKQLAAYSHLPKLRRLCFSAPCKQAEHPSLFKFPRLEKLALFDPTVNRKAMEEKYRKQIIPSATFNWDKDLGVSKDLLDSWFEQRK
jgi:serine/threonine protein kinase